MQREEYVNRWIEVDFKRLPEQIQVTFSDQGAGFEWSRYLDFDPDRAFDPHGRGIAMAKKLSFDHLEYLGCGNQVRVSVNLDT
jgi:anti-sigma regulatory factor (Ser/Thr protein kinase)